MAETRTVRAALYLRVSTADQGRTGFSLPEQRRACMEHVNRLMAAMARETGGALRPETTEFVDTAGGDLLERPELERARRYVKEIRPDFFICLDPDRFSRSTHQAIVVANEIEEAGTRLEFVQHDYQTTSEGRLFFTLRVAIAEYEKAKILERTARGKRGKLAAGGIPHGIRAYGYDFVPEGKRELQRREGHPDPGALRINQAEAAWVRRIFAWAADQGMGSQAVADELNRLGVPSKRGGRWTRGVVAAILRNPLYIGRLRLNRFDFTGLGAQLHLPGERRTRKLTPRIRRESDWVTLPVPAIVDEGLFSRVQARLARARPRPRIGPGARQGGRLLSGLASCGLCRAPVHYAYSSRSRGYLLRCSRRYPATRPDRCRLPHRKASSVEGAVRAWVREWLKDSALLRGITSPAGSAGAGALEQIGRLKQGQAQILDLVAAGLVAPDVARRKLGDLAARLADLRRSAEQESGPAAWPTDPQAFQAELDARLRLLTPQEEQTLWRMLHREILVGPDGGVRPVPTG